MPTSAGYRALAFSAVLIACSSAARAEDLGVVGPVYAISEPNLLAVIRERLEALRDSGRLAHLEEDAGKRYVAYARNPPGVALPRATRHRVRYHDPSVTVPYALRDAKGKPFQSAGTTVNPLDYMTLSERLLFFDGEDPAQVAWARNLYAKDPAHTKPILTRGLVLDLIRDWGAWLYLDQHGQLVAKLGIEALPAIVRQEGRRLRIEEVVLPEDDR